MEYSLARGAVNSFNSFLYPTCINCRGVSDIVSLKRSFFFYFLRGVNEWYTKRV